MLAVNRSKLGQLLRILMLLAPLSSPALAIDGDEMFSDPAKEAHAREIGRQLRCMVCQNQSIFDSNSGLAKDLRVLVRQRMDEGESDKEILNYIAGRYGDYVLLNPRLSLQNAVLWATPGFALMLGVGLMVAYLKSRKTYAAQSDISDEERRMVQKLLKEGWS